TVAADLLVDDDVDHDIALRRQPELLQVLNREHVAGDAALHVARAPAVDASVLDLGRPWFVAPALAVTNGNDVSMAIEQQGAAAAGSLEVRDDVRAILVATINRTVAGMLLQLIPVRLPHIDLKTDLLEVCVHVLLNGGFVAGHARNRDHV